MILGDLQYMIFKADICTFLFGLSASPNSFRAIGQDEDAGEIYTPDIVDIIQTTQ